MRNGTDNLFPFVSRCIVSVLCRLIWYKLVGEPAFIEAKPKLPALPKGVRELWSRLLLFHCSSLYYWDQSFYWSVNGCAYALSNLSLPEGCTGTVKAPCQLQRNAPAERVSNKSLRVLHKIRATSPQRVRTILLSFFGWIFVYGWKCCVSALVVCCSACRIECQSVTALA